MIINYATLRGTFTKSRVAWGLCGFVEIANRFYLIITIEKVKIKGFLLNKRIIFIFKSI